MRFNKPHPALVFFLAAASLVTYLTSCGPLPSMNDPRPAVKGIKTDLAQQNADLQAQNKLLQEQLATIKTAIDAAGATGSFIDQSIAWGGKALGLVGSIPDAVSALTAQKKTLASAKTSNETTATELHNALSDNSKLIATNAALVTKNTALAAKADAAVAQVEVSEKEKADLRGRADKAEKFIDDHKDDIFGAKVHRIVRGIGILTAIIFGVGIIAIGILGCMYGLPKITQPAASILGSVINGVRVVGYYVGTFVLSCLGPVGHWIDEHLFNHNKLKEQVAAIQHPAPILAGTNRGPLNVTTTAPAAPPAV